MKIAIHCGGKDGFIKYDEPNKEVLVSHPDEGVRQTVHGYLNSPRPFILPHPNANENMPFATTREIRNPVQDADTLQMALSEMKFYTNVGVKWNHPDNKFPEIKDMSAPDPNAKADKPIVKSVDGTDYEIIN